MVAEIRPGLIVQWKGEPNRPRGVVVDNEGVRTLYAMVEFPDGAVAIVHRAEFWRTFEEVRP